MSHAHNFNDLSGQTFGRLTVIGFAEIRNKRTFWNCQCLCGNTTQVYGQHLRSELIRSCGCLRKETTGKISRKHGMSHKSIPEYTVWCGMRARCNDPNHHSYKRYGRKGIQVCSRWDDFTLFLTDMGVRPSPDHSIERRDRTKGYSPDNCYWATLEEQANNRSNNHLLTFQGKSQSIARWCRELHLDYRLVNRRIGLGWSDIDALTKPVRRPN